MDENLWTQIRLDFRKVLRLDTRGTKDFSYLIGANLATQKRVAELGQSE